MNKSVSMHTWIIALFLPFLVYAESTSFSTLEEEYTPRYCLQLEAAYGDGMMSEGGAEGIEVMFEQVPLSGKSALDIGSGLGGVPFYLAEKYGMRITGLEVNPWMVRESKRRVPSHLVGKVDFVLSIGNSNWPIDSESLDLVYSKGVLTHLERKEDLLKECHRLLKDRGLLVITDWLSSDEKKWGENIAKLVELENLALYPESVSGYIDLLERNGFTVLSSRNDSALYFRFNQEIVERLRDPTRRDFLLKQFTEPELEDAVYGYQSIARALAAEELKVYRFIAQRK